MLLNTTKPYSGEAKDLAAHLGESYGVRVLPVNCQQLKKEDITLILGEVLNEFPIAEIDLYMPQWAELLPPGHWLKEKLLELRR